MKRSGFTMIELVFVIVILGILAAVAVPKLTATRTDAAATTGVSTYKTVLSDLTTSTMAAGSLATNIIDSTTASSTVVEDGTGLKILAGGKKCAKIARTSDTTITITNGTDSEEPECALITAQYPDGLALNLLGTGVTR